MMTTSHPASHVPDWTACRSILFTRLRTTAFPTRLLTENPILVCSSSLGVARITSRLLTHDLP